MKTQTCRLCLVVGVKVYEFRDTEAKTFIEDIFKNNGFNLSLDNHYFICYMCRALLYKSHCFIQRSLKAQGMLYKILNSQETFNYEDLKNIDRDKLDLSLGLCYSKMEVCYIDDVGSRIDVNEDFKYVKEEPEPLAVKEEIHDEAPLESVETETNEDENIDNHSEIDIDEKTSILSPDNIVNENVVEQENCIDSSMIDNDLGQLSKDNEPDIAEEYNSDEYEDIIILNKNIDSTVVTRIEIENDKESVTDSKENILEKNDQGKVSEHRVLSKKVNDKKKTSETDSSTVVDTESTKSGELDIEENVLEKDTPQETEAIQDKPERRTVQEVDKAKELLEKKNGKKNSPEGPDTDNESSSDDEVIKKKHNDEDYKPESESMDETLEEIRHRSRVKKVLKRKMVRDCARKCELVKDYPRKCELCNYVVKKANYHYKHYIMQHSNALAKFPFRRKDFPLSEKLARRIVEFKSKINLEIDSEEERESKKKKKKKYERTQRPRQKDYCFYCETLVLNFARHVIRHHSSETEVKKILSCPVKSFTRKNLLTALRKKGNYINNTEEECFKPMKVSKCTTEVEYKSCPKCLGFYAKKHLWKHKRLCDKISVSLSSQNEGKAKKKKAEKDKKDEKNKRTEKKRE